MPADSLLAVLAQQLLAHGRPGHGRTVAGPCGRAGAMLRWLRYSVPQRHPFAVAPGPGRLWTGARRGGQHADFRPLLPISSSGRNVLRQEGKIGTGK